MAQSTRMSRRSFLTLNAKIAGALAIGAAFPALAAAQLIPVTTHTDTRSNALDLPQPSAIRFGTPTDVAAAWSGHAWSVDGVGSIHRFDRATRTWLPDDADQEADFPVDSRVVLARWGRPAGPNQMLMVLSGARG